MIYKMEKLDRVIDKIIRDLGCDQIDHADFIEWIADGIQHIGAYPQFEQKECYVGIENYVGFLPCDLHKVIRMTNACEIAVGGDGGFYGGTVVNALNNLGVDYESLTAYDRLKLAVPGISKLENNFTELTNKLRYNGNLIGNPEINSHTSLDFNVNFDKITTSFCNGLITVQYLAMPVDERGWPLVPDDVSFRDALFWKCAYHLSMRDPMKLKNPRMQDMEYCRQQWNRTCVQARAGANMPDLDAMIRLKNNWTRLLNTTNDEVNDFSATGVKQILNLNGLR